MPPDREFHRQDARSTSRGSSAMASQNLYLVPQKPKHCGHEVAAIERLPKKIHTLSPSPALRVKRMSAKQDAFQLRIIGTKLLEQLLACDIGVELVVRNHQSDFTLARMPGFDRGQGGTRH